MGSLWALERRSGEAADGYLLSAFVAEQVEHRVREWKRDPGPVRMAPDGLPSATIDRFRES
jgi:hypothetical protein